MQAQAIVKNIKASPQKLNLVAAMVRGKHIAEAMNIVQFNQKRAATDVGLGLKAALANAEHNFNMNMDALYVAHAYVGKNMQLKRMHARGRGRSARVKKHYSQITIVLEERN
jgi:large subunit ribosomal protein L22